MRSEEIIVPPHAEGWIDDGLQALARRMIRAQAPTELILDVLEEIMVSRLGRLPRPGEIEWLRLRRLVFRRDGRQCRYCLDTAGPFAIDHIVPLCRGGSNDPLNLVVACRACNSSKGSRSVTEWRGPR